jgi:hypothetical protein
MMWSAAVRLLLVVSVTHGLVGCGGADPPLAPTTAGTTVSFTSGVPIIIGNASDTAFRPLSGVRVEVLDGPHAGVAAVSDARGELRLAGVFDDATRFRGSKDGYLSDTTVLDPECTACLTQSPNRHLSLALSIDAPVVSIAGEYLLTIEADDRCTTLPEVARSRRFAVTVVPTERLSQRFTIRLPGAFVGYEWFGLGVAGSYLSGWLGHDGPLVVEQLAPNVYVGFDGEFAATLEAPPVQVITARYDGTISYCERHTTPGSNYTCTAADAAVMSQCISNNHRVTLARR